MRLDSFRREPWSTMITPSLSPTPFVFGLNPPFPVAKHPFADKYLPFLQLLCNFTKLGRTHLGFDPISHTEDLECRKRKQIKIVHSSNMNAYKKRVFARNLRFVYPTFTVGFERKWRRRQERKLAIPFPPKSAPTHRKNPIFCLILIALCFLENQTDGDWKKAGEEHLLTVNWQGTDTESINRSPAAWNPTSSSLRRPPYTLTTLTPYKLKRHRLLLRFVFCIVLQNVYNRISFKMSTTS